jgi:hypothetical protein
MSKTTLQTTGRMNQTVAALARLLDQVMNDIQVLDTEFQDHVSATSAERETERARLMAECENANQLLAQARKEHKRAQAETDEAAAIALELQVSTAVNRMRAELTAQMDADRAALVAERNRAQQRLADSASDHERELTEAVNKVRLELAVEIESLRQQVEEAKHAAAQAQESTLSEASGDWFKGVQDEIVRVGIQIHTISQIVENRDTELSIVIRKNVERAELESYLRGLRFSISMAEERAIGRASA